MILKEYSNINEAYMGLGHELLLNPQNVISPRCQRVNELQNIGVIINGRQKLVSLSKRKINLKYFVGELVFYLVGSNSLSHISHYSKFWNKVSDDGRIVNSAYGKRLFYEKAQGCFQNSFDYCVDLLAQDKDSRKAVMPIYKLDDNKPSHDNPCTMYLSLMIRCNKLYTTVHMRSNDIWFGFTYDVPFFMIVQEMVHNSLLSTYPDLELGPYTHFANSLHLYEKDFDDMRNLVESSINDIDNFERIPDLCNQDIDSWFFELIAREHEKRNKIQQTILFEANITDFQSWCIDKL
jgi:thymidylate synthase